MKKPKDITGQTGEKLARDFLVEQQYKIIEQNYESAFGEIDLIACKNGIVSFIEVKTRRGLNFGQPENSVTGSKQSKMARLAVSYLQKKNIKNVACNLGVISVLLKEPKPEITFFENAFLLNDLLPESFNY